MAFNNVPLNWVRSFEKVARLRSFQAAAEELHVTPGAISQQIKKLENALGDKLFDRHINPITLTPSGQTLFDNLGGALRQIETALAEVTQPAVRGTLKIWGSRFFMRLWLLPRLHLFQRKYPNIAVELITAPPNTPVSLDCDLAIRVGRDPNANFHTEALMRRVAVPVCSPDYLTRHPKITEVAQIPEHHLLRGSTHDDEWKLWFSANGIDRFAADSITTLSSSDLSHAAAMEGVGIALGRLGFIDKDVAEGRLIILTGKAADVGAPFYLHHRKNALRRSELFLFRQWLIHEVGHCTSLNRDSRTSSDLTVY